jgi:hypothetical protein
MSNQLSRSYFIALHLYLDIVKYPTQTNTPTLNQNGSKGAEGT